MSRLIILAILMLPIPSLVSAQVTEEEGQYIKLTPPSMRLHKCKEGPWGDLEYHYLFLEAPLSTVELINVPSGIAVWWFPEKNIEQVREFLINSGASSEEVDSRIEFSSGYQTGSSFKYFPSSEFINALEPKARETIYAELRKWPENKRYHAPVVIASGSVSDWFRKSGLRNETILHIERLSYPLGNALGFSDVSTVVKGLHDDKEERLLLKALTRTRSLILSLQIAPGTDTEALKNYWSAGYKSKDVLPLFDSIARIEGLDTIDVTRLLPPTPRKYLYTFPSRAMGIDGTYPNSLWASLNFFNYFPDEQIDEMGKVMSFFTRNYDVTPGPPTFGDLIMMKDVESGRPIHSCVFIADDIVYSKNGRSILKPFMLMKMDELYNHFAINEKPILEIWRKRER
ncbi:hypothetical protein N9B73_07520 [Verrucomicrobiales bacterium]|nr:hypothetical protein [Verrucomicrobiales bacterium]